MAIQNSAYQRRRIIWKAVNRVRNTFAKRLLDLWIKHMKAYLDGDNMAISEALRITYIEVGGNFARFQFNKIVRQKALGDVDDMFDVLMAKYAREEGAPLTASIQNTLKSRLDTILAKDLTLAEQIAEIDRMIIARANVVAQAEITRASNVGDFFGQQQGAVISGSRLVRTWIATIDAVVRDSHDNADGQSVHGQDSFIVGGYSLQYPGDPSGPIELTVNCRCVIDAQKVKES